MPTPHLPVDAVLKAAHAAALRQLKKPVQADDHTDAMRSAVAQVWGLVKGKLPAKEAEALDALITRLVGPTAGPEPTEASAQNGSKTQA